MDRDRSIALVESINSEGPCAFCDAYVEVNEESGLVFLTFLSKDNGIYVGGKRMPRFKHPESAYLVARACDTCAIDLAAATVVGEAESIRAPSPPSPGGAE